MRLIREGDLLWQPTAATVEHANLTRYRQWVNRRHDLSLPDYDTLWRWSVNNIDDFWAGLFDYFELPYSGSTEPALAERGMPGARWFPNVTLNYAECIFSRATEARPMAIAAGEDRAPQALSWAEMRRETARLAAVLRQLGVGRGDRVVAYMPNIPEAIVGVLAVASLGAIWSSCSPDFGSRSVLDRFSQIEPRVLLAVDGYTYGGKQHDRRAVVAELQAALPSLAHTILLPQLGGSADGLTDTILWADALGAVDDDVPLTFTPVPFDHPLWVLYSSGTTGLPKPIVHGHGGIVLEHAKATALHNDLGPADRFFWYSSTGWMMWNYLIGGLLSGATIITYDGAPNRPDMDVLFRLAEQTGMTYFGTSAAFIAACIKAGNKPNEAFDLSRIRAVGSTGSPLTVEGFAWIYDNINEDLALESLSGGTDLCTAFVGGARVLPIYAGEIQGASLGAHVQSFDEAGRPHIGQVGELVITEPMPSMPLYFWNDPGMERYQASYFEMYPGIWRHGDWILFNERGGCIIYGRSDSTINRQGVRMGTSEIYRVVEGFDEILDSLIVDLEFRGRDSYLPLFVVLRGDVTLDDQLRTAIKQRLRQDVSPRHVPTVIIPIDEVPYTLSGKKMEVPVRKILLGLDRGKAANPGAMRNPAALAFFRDFASEINGTDTE